MKKFLEVAVWIIIAVFLVIIIGTSEVLYMHWLASLIALLVSIPVVVSIHELGHLFFGKLIGFEFASFRVFFGSFDQVNGRIKLRVRRNKGFSGMCIMLPPYRVTRVQLMLYFSGGIIFGLFFALAALTVAAVVSSPAVIAAFLTCAIFALVVSAVNLIPMLSGGLYSDGKYIFDLIKGGDVAKIAMKQFRYASHVARGIRPKHISPSGMTYGAEVKLNADELNFIIHDYFHYLDAGDTETMKEIIETIESHLFQISPVVLPGVYNELIYYYSAVCKDSEKAEMYYQQNQKLLKKDKDVNGLRVKAAHAYYIQNDMETARQYADEGLKVWDQFVLKGQRLMERELILKLPLK